MNNLVLKVQRFLVSDDGPTAVEYGVMLALIVAVCAVAVKSLGTQVSGTFSSVSSSLS
jgi:pilus assembly protein Flp/PilA